ncbi:MAG: hypothetical protein J6U04_03230 [Salinivirgaceae bacterium]|nr:hypothetical protein [Salinivirgaceae bacterium]
MFSKLFNSSNKPSRVSARTNARKRRIVVDECFDKIVTELFVKFLPSQKRIIG